MEKKDKESEMDKALKGMKEELNISNPYNKKKKENKIINIWTILLALVVIIIIYSLIPSKPVIIKDDTTININTKNNYSSNMKKCKEYLNIAAIHEKGMGSSNDKEVLESGIKYTTILKKMINQCDFPVPGMNEEIKRLYNKSNTAIKNLYELPQTINTAPEDCYSLAYKFGSCVARSYKGLTCKVGTDIVMPPRCNDKQETKAGMKAGMKEES